jgi:transcriptional regulator with XRE-family HTH domain
MRVWVAEKNIVNETVRKLRVSLSETQEQFARRMNTAVVTIARWETSRPPRGKALRALEDLAASVSMTEYAAIFARARKGEFPAPKRTVAVKGPEAENEREKLRMLALLRVLRNPDHYKASIRMVEKGLGPAMRDIENLMTDAQAKADVPGAILRLAQKGNTPEQIGEVLGVEIETVTTVLALATFGFFKETK